MDHDALKHLSTQDKVSSRHASMIGYLQQFTFVIKHTTSSNNQVANSLSRMHSLLQSYMSLFLALVHLLTFILHILSLDVFGRMYNQALPQIIPSMMASFFDTRVYAF